MKTTQNQSARLAVVLAGFAAYLCGTMPVGADVIESARMLPDDVTIMVSIESVSDVRAAIKKTSFYDLYKDPALEQLSSEATKKIRKQIDDAIKDFWKEAEVDDPPEQLPYPEGRLVLGMSFSLKPAAGRDSGDEDPDIDEQVVEFRLVLLADMSGKIAQVRQLIRALSAGAAGTGDTIKRTEVAGVELETVVPDEDNEDPVIFYGLKDNWLLLTADSTRGTDFTESVVRRIGRSLPNSLSDQPGLVAAARTLGDAHAFVFANADSLRRLATASNPDKVKAERIVTALGLENVIGLAGSIEIAGQRNQDVCTKMLVAVDGPKTGIPALLAMPSAPLRLNDRLITRDTVQFSCLNLEPSRLFDGIGKIVGAITFMDINMMAQAAMLATAGEGGQPPVQLRDEVLAQLAAPLFIASKSSPTMRTIGTHSGFGVQFEFIAGMSVRDGNRLDTALGRIHHALFGGSPDLRRELLDHTIYVLSPGRPAVPGDDAASAAEPPGAGGMALSVIDDTLVLGSPVGSVEQAIRSLQGQPDDALASDPMFRYARRYLPAQAGAYHYRNNRLDAEETWKALRRTARELSTREQDGSDAEKIPANPIAAALQQLSEHIDLSELPEFREIQEYWGATVGFLQDRPEGVYWESTILKPAQE